MNAKKYAEAIASRLIGGDVSVRRTNGTKITITSSGALKVDPESIVQSGQLRTFREKLRERRVRLREAG